MRLGLAKAMDRVLGNVAGRVLAWTDGIRETLRAPAPVADVEHLLVVKFWGLGNWALLRPIVRDLKDRYPAARLTIATLAANRDLVDDLADDLLLVRPHALPTVVGDLTRAVLRLRRRTPDLAIDFEQFARAGALLARMGGTRQRLGFASGSPSRDGLYTARVPFLSDRHASRSFRDLAEAAGLPRAPYVAGALEATEAGRRELHDLLPDGAPWVILHPGSGDNFPGRRWSEAGFAAAGRTSTRRGLRVFVTGGASEVTLADRVARAVGRGAHSLAGRLSVRGLIALIAEARAVVTNDTGPVHLASALDVPALAVFGPNTPLIYGPLSRGSAAFYRALPCSPCLTTANYRSSPCRIHTCTASIPVGEVTGALARCLETGSAAHARECECEPAREGAGRMR